MVARPHLPPRKMKSPATKMLPLLPNHSLPIKTLILFLILRWEGWDERDRGAVGPVPLSLPGLAVPTLAV